MFSLRVGGGAVLTRDELMLRLTQRYTEDAVGGEALDADFEEVPEDASEDVQRVITG